MAIRIQSRQSGTATIAGSAASGTVSISSVASGKRLLKFTYRVNESDPGDALTEGYFSSSTQLTFIRQAGSSTEVVNIEWEVIEFTSASNISIQELSVSDIDDGETTTITSSVIANSFIIGSWYNGGTIFADDDIFVPELTSTTQITYRIQASDIDKASLFVVTSSDITTQFVSTLDSIAGQIETTISAITQARSWAVGWTKPDAGSASFNQLCTIEFSSTTNLRRFREAGTEARDFYAFVIQMPSDWATSWGYCGMGIDSTTATITISVTDTAKTFLHMGSGESLSAGRTTEPGDNMGKAFATLALTSTTNINATRAASGTYGGTYTAWAIEDKGGSSAQTLVPSAISSGEAIGSATVTPGNVNVAPTAIDSNQAFGTPALTVGNVNVAPSAIGSAQAFGTTVITTGNVNVAPSGIATQEGLGTPSLTPGNVNLAPTAIGSSEAFGTSSLGLGIVSTAIDSAESIPAPAIVPGNVNLDPDEIPSAEGWGTPSLIPGNVNVVPDSVLSDEVVSYPDVQPDSAFVLPGTIDSEEWFGILTIYVGPVNIDTTGIASLEGIGSPSLSLQIDISSLPEGGFLGGVVVTPGNVNIAFDGIESSEEFGTTTSVTPGAVPIVPNGVVSQETFGTPLIIPGNVDLTVLGISTAGAVGSPEIHGLTVYVLPEGIASGEALGLAVVLGGNVTLQPTGIASSEVFGSIWVLMGGVVLFPDGVPTEEIFGGANLYAGPIALFNIGRIPSGESFGYPLVHPSYYAIGPSSIDSSEDFGTASIGVKIHPSSVVGGEVFGDLGTVKGPVSILPQGIISRESLGSAIIRNLWVLGVSGIPSIEIVSGLIVTRVTISTLKMDFERDLNEVFFRNDFEFAEAMQYLCVDGEQVYLKGIFDNEYEAVDVQAGTQVMSSSPVAWIQTSKLLREPAKGDKMIIRGIRFKIIDNQPDGTGVSMLFLHRENQL